MTIFSLVPCPSCARHVRAERELSCPFCRVALPPDLGRRAVPGAAHRRLSRLAAFTFAATAIVTGATTALPGCGGRVSGDEAEGAAADAGDAASDTRQPPLCQPESAPCSRHAECCSLICIVDVDAEAGVCGSNALYGAPPPDDDF